MNSRSALQGTAFLTILLVPIFAFTQTISTPPRPIDSSSYGKLPLSFEANQGQVDPAFQFLSHGRGYTLLLREGEAVLALQGAKPTLSPDKVPPIPFIDLSGHTQDQETSVVRLALVGANPNATAVREDQQVTKTNYFIGNDPSKWRTNIPNYGRIRYQSVYDGVDLVYYGNQRQLEHDFIVAPHADPAKIALAVSGAQKLRIDPASGDLLMSIGQSTLRLLKPVTYQESGNAEGQRTQVASGYRLLKGNKVGFSLGQYNSAKPLIIDPVLVYSTYLGGQGGGAGGDQGNGIAVDKTGSAYTVGTTGSLFFPITTGAFQTTQPGTEAVFVSKLTPDGSALAYSTYLSGFLTNSFGGYPPSNGYAIALDSKNNAYITGTTESVDFPVTCGALQTADPSYTGNAPTGFVAALTADGSSLIYSTYLGGSGNRFASHPLGDVPQAIAVSATGIAYVTGYTVSYDFPVTSSAYQPTLKGSGLSSNAFISAINAAGTALVYSTYLGGSGVPPAPGGGGTGDIANGIVLDSNGDAFVAGSATSTDFPVTSGVVQTALAGTSNAFVTGLNPAGTDLIYSTYLGGSGSDSARAVALDSNGFVYIAGDTTSGNFPVTSGVLEGTASGIGPYLATNGPGAFVTKLSKDGSALEYSTYLEGQSTSVYGLAVDSSGSAYITGSAPTLAPSTYGEFQTTSDALTTPTGPTSGFLVKLDPTAAFLNYATLLGGSASDAAYAIALDSTGNAYLTGMTKSADFPTTTGAFQTTFDDPPGSPNSVVPVMTVLSQSLMCYIDAPGYLVTVEVQISSPDGGPSPTGSVNFYGSFTIGEGAQVNPSGPGTSTVTALGTENDAVAQSATWEMDYSGDAYYLPASITGSVTGPGNCDSQPDSLPGGSKTPTSKLRSTAARSQRQSVRPLGAADLRSDLVPRSSAGTATPDASTFPPVSNAFISKFALAGEDNQTTYPPLPSGIPTSLTLISARWYSGDDWAIEATAVLNSGGPGPPPTGTIQLLVNGVPPYVPSSPATNWTGVSAQMSLWNYPNGNGAPGSPWEVDYSGDAVYKASTVTGTATSVLQGGLATGSASASQPTVILHATSADPAKANEGIATLTPEKLNALRVKFIPALVTLHTSSQASLTRPASQENATCTAPAQPTLTFSPTSITFPNTGIGMSAPTEVLTVTNTSSIPASVSSYKFSGANAGEFSIQSKTCVPSLAAGASCTLAIAFKATAPGNASASLVATDNASGSPQSVPLTALVPTLPTVAFSPGGLAFPPTRVNASSGPVTLTVTDTSATYPISVTSYAFTGTNAGEFVIVGKTCETSLAAGQSCTLSIEFRPTTLGTASASLTATDNAIGSPQTVSLTGSATAPAVTISFTPTTLTFPATALNASSPTQVLTVTNTSTQYAAAVSSYKFSGLSASEFVMTSKTCLSTLAASQSCTLSIAFRPTTFATVSATLVATDSGYQSPQSIPLVATIIPPRPTLNFSPASLVFPVTALGTTSAAMPITVSNTSSTATSDISSYFFAGTNATEFALASKTCLSTLAPGASCTLSIIFKPSITGPASATFSATDDGANAAQSVSLTGTTAAPPAITFSPASLTFPATNVGATSAPQILTVSNTSSSVMKVNSYLFSGTNASEFSLLSKTCSTSLPANSSCTLTIVFKPTTTGAASASLIATDDAVGSPQSIALTGTGQ